jgi:hypothetical protein
MTLIETEPHRWGWRVFKAPGVEPVFLQKDQAIGLCGDPRSTSYGRDSHF